MGNKKAFALIFGTLMLAASTFSFAKNDLVGVHAATDVNIGELSFAIDKATHGEGIYMVTSSANSIPYDTNKWTIRLRPVGTGAVIVNGTDISSTNINICKFEPLKYYLALKDVTGYATRNVGDVVTIKGSWKHTSGSTNYLATIKETSFSWTGTRWKIDYSSLDLEYYDKISLKDASIRDFDREIIDNENNPRSDNTYVESTLNSTRSFSFEFLYESYKKGTSDNDSLAIRIGSSGSWVAGHYIQLTLNNYWGPNGVIVIHDKVGDTITFNTPDIEVNLLPGARHLIEYGCVAIKNSNQHYLFVKYDGEAVYEVVNTINSQERSTKVGIFYPNADLFLGDSLNHNATGEDELDFDPSIQSGKNGVYLTGPVNDIPVLDNWQTRAVPVDVNNFLINGNSVLPKKYNTVTNFPFIKHQDSKYYLSFLDNGIAINEGDVISLDREFHFYVDGKAYKMNLKSFNLLYSDGKYTVIPDLKVYLLEQLSDSVMRELYDDDKLVEIDEILSQTSNTFAPLTINKDIWDAYRNSDEALSNVPMNEEKAQQYIAEYRANAIARISAVDKTIYLDEQVALIDEYLADAIAQINLSSVVKDINDVVKDFENKVSLLPTKQEEIERRVLAFEGGYEEYLNAFEVVTTTDLNLSQVLGFHPFETNSSFNNDHNPKQADNFFPVGPENKDGNVIFKFKYISNDTLSSKYGAQVYVRMRGTTASSYRFSIAQDIDGKSGLSFGAFLHDVLQAGSNMSFAYGFLNDTQYEIELGTLDLKEYDRTLVFAKVNGEVVMKNIINSLALDTDNSIIISDSHTHEGSDAHAYVSASESGTTKYQLASHVYSLKLSSSTTTSINVSTKKNSVPSGATLMPLESNAIKINGVALINTTLSSCITKTSENTFTIDLTALSYVPNNQDTLTISGLFSYFDDNTENKEVFNFGTSMFMFDGSSWIQQAVSLDSLKEEANEFINNYVILDDYSSDNQTRVDSIITTGLNAVSSANTAEEVDLAIDNFIANIDEILTILGEFKVAKIDELNNYRLSDLYYEEEQQELADILSAAAISINAANNENDIESIVASTKVEIDTIKTIAQYQAEELRIAKNNGKTTVEVLVGLLEIERYSESNWAIIRDLAFSTRDAIDNAPNIEQIDVLVQTFEDAIKNVATVDGSKFNGETYITGKTGCGGDVVTTSLCLSVISIMTLTFLVLRKKYLLG